MVFLTYGGSYIHSTNLVTWPWTAGAVQAREVGDGPHSPTRPPLVEGTHPCLVTMLPIWVPSFASSQDIQMFPIGRNCNWPANRPHLVKERKFSFFLLKLQKEYARLSILWLLIKHLPCTQTASALILGPCYPDLQRSMHA